MVHLDASDALSMVVDVKIVDEFDSNSVDYNYDYFASKNYSDDDDYFIVYVVVEGHHHYYHRYLTMP